MTENEGKEQRKAQTAVAPHESHIRRDGSQMKQSDVDCIVVTVAENDTGERLNTGTGHPISIGTLAVVGSPTTLVALAAGGFDTSDDVKYGNLRNVEGENIVDGIWRQSKNRVP